MKNLFIVSLCLIFAGCATLTSKQIEKPFVEPQYGMTKIQLTNLIGRPQAIEIYKKTDLTRVEFYIYERQYQSSQEKVPVCLIDNKVVGWGESYYEDHISPDDVRIK
jgi:outer membrane protein assembly factor BamE (lipoprotein component of BamABCDE complex)